ESRSVLPCRAGPEGTRGAAAAASRRSVGVPKILARPPKGPGPGPLSGTARGDPVGPPLQWSERWTDPRSVLGLTRTDRLLRRLGQIVDVAAGNGATGLILDLDER